MIYDFEVYTGKSMKLPGSLCISGNIVMCLLKNLEEHKDFKVYFDNWFTSVDLAKALKDSGLGAVGTICQNRLSGCQLASDKKLKDSGRESYLELYRTDLRSRKWYMGIVFYCLDEAVVNGWLRYQRHMEQNKVDKKAIQPLRNFRATIAHALPKKGYIEDAHYDNIANWQIYSEKNMRCKLCVTGFTRIKSSKCELGLCLNNNNNCFVDFHTK